MTTLTSCYLECVETQKEINFTDIAKDKVDYEDLFCNDVSKQKQITTLFKELFQTEEKFYRTRAARRPKAPL